MSFTKKAEREPAGEDDGREQVLRLQAIDDPFRDPIEKSCDPQVGNDQHHREQQDDGGEVDGGQRRR
jgi:hypothetical protein